MSTRFKTVTGEVIKELLWCYEKHGQNITGMIETAGSFNGGMLSFYISLSGGDFITPWTNADGEHYQVMEPQTREFCLPVVNRHNGSVSIYYSFSGSSNPNVRITVGDNTGRLKRTQRQRLLLRMILRQACPVALS